MEKFSVAISVYKNDNPLFFKRALGSITDNQSVLPDEIVLVVDGPVNEAINKVIEEYKNKYNIFNIIYLEKNKGLGNALKIAVENSKYDLIARMDSDDVSIPTRFEEQLLILKKNSRLDIVGGDISEFIGEESNIVSKRKVPVKDCDIKKYIKKRCPFNHVTVMFRKESVLNAGNYKDLFWNEDYYLWIRMLENKCNMENTGTILVNVRVGKDMYKRRGGLKYFKSEIVLQNYMLDKKIITLPTYLDNSLKRLILQVMMPNWLRGWIFKKFAREKENE